MSGQYGISETFGNAWALLMTKAWFPEARLVRRPFYLRGNLKHFEYGPGLTIDYSCRFENGPKGHIKLGSNCKIYDRVHISSYESVTIGDDVLVASNFFISDNSHGSYKDNSSGPALAPNDRPIAMAPVTIGDRGWIGEVACILPGVTLGSGGVVGSNAVVTHAVSENQSLLEYRRVPSNGGSGPAAPGYEYEHTR